MKLFFACVSVTLLLCLMGASAQDCPFLPFSSMNNFNSNATCVQPTSGTPFNLTSCSFNLTSYLTVTWDKSTNTLVTTCDPSDTSNCGSGHSYNNTVADPIPISQLTEPTVIYTTQFTDACYTYWVTSGSWGVSKRSSKKDSLRAALKAERSVALAEVSKKALQRKIARREGKAVPPLTTPLSQPRQSSTCSYATVGITNSFNSVNSTCQLGGSPVPHRFSSCWKPLPYTSLESAYVDSSNVLHIACNDSFGPCSSSVAPFSSINLNNLTGCTPVYVDQGTNSCYQVLVCPATPSTASPRVIKDNLRSVDAWLGSK